MKRMNSCPIMRLVFRAAPSPPCARFGLSRRPIDVSDGVPNLISLSLHPDITYSRWDGIAFRQVGARQRL